MKKALFPSLLFSFYCSLSFAQKISPASLKVLRRTEDSLRQVARLILNGISTESRFSADSSFTVMFVRALKNSHSFYYPFDSLVTISKLAPPDSSFRIFTWQLNVNDNINRQHGAIQFNTKDGSLKLLPLIDKSDVIADAADTVAGNFDWVGALYYKIIEKEYAGKKFYTLLGYDENNISSTKKIIDVLTFTDGRPVFGGPYFSFANGVKSPARFIMEYKKDAGPRLNFDEDLDMIVYEHLISETNEPDKKYTYIPDGDYEGLQWRGGRWVYIEKVFTQTLKEGEAPVPEPIRDDKGNIDESRLKNVPVKE